MQTKDIPLERLTVESFSPYGWLLKANGTPDFSRPGLNNWRLPFHSDAALRLQVMRYAQQEIRLTRFERHICVTEARSPIGNAAAVLVVAGDPARDLMPDAASVRAFYLDGETGIMFRKGTWHGLDCFPARTPYVDYLFLSDTATEDEIEADSVPHQGIRTQIFDFATQKVEFRVVDPEGLLT